MTTADTSSGRATLRDVADAQRETRGEIASLREEVLGRIDGVADTLDELKDGVLQRVATLEAHRVEDRADINHLKTDVEGLKNARALATGHIGAWKMIGTVVGGAATLVLGDLVLHWLGA